MRSYQTKLQASFVLLGLAAVAITGWESSATATAALRDATVERLTAITETKGRQVERYFQDLGNHVLALSSDTSTLEALENFAAAWPKIPPENDAALLEPVYKNYGPGWVPHHPGTRRLQLAFPPSSPHLLNPPGLGPYGDAHARYHPNLHRYQSAFGFYDTLLIDTTGLVVYSVIKEIDLGMSLREGPYPETALAQVFERALRLPEPETYAVADYQPYVPSQSAPAAFYAAPLWRRGVKIGVLAIQVSAAELNRVMTGGGRWKDEGLGDSGQAYIVGTDGRLRSELRRGTAAGKSAILSTRAARQDPAYLRAQTALRIPGVSWVLVAEIEAREALAPVLRLETKLMTWAVILALLTLIAAWLLARRVIRPVQALAEAAGRISGRDFGARIPVTADDEIGALAAAFNRMAENLQTTTVSKQELEAMAGRLITVQEEERTRIARELHDDITQRLAALAIEAGKLQRVAPSEEAERLKTAIMRVSEDVRDLSRSLHHTTLDDQGLTAAIEGECRAFFERGGPPVTFTPEGEFDDVPRDVQLALYRIVQEGLRNMERHAGADEASIELVRGPGLIDLRLCDNGRGFDITDRRSRRGVGLASMEERAQLCHGTFSIHSQPGHGTRIEVRLPIGK